MVMLLLSSSLATPIKYIPRAQMINGISAMANMMKFVWFSCLVSSKFRLDFYLLVGKLTSLIRKLVNSLTGSFYNRLTELLKVFDCFS